jgi:HAD superfamily hydrolase (TIGR01549 family)
VIRAVLFDFGATIILDDRFDYFASLRKVHRVLENAGLVPPFEGFKRDYLKVRATLWNDPELREYSYNYRLAEVLKLYGHNLTESDPRIQSATKVFTDALVESLYMEDFVPGLLAQLHDCYKLALVSNLGIPEVLPLALNRFGLAEYFDVILASGAVGYRKPSPIIFNEALKALGALPEEAVFVGDSLYHDIQGAKAVSMKTVWIKRKENQENTTATPDKTINDLRELPKTLALL